MTSGLSLAALSGCDGGVSVTCRYSVETSGLSLAALSVETSGLSLASLSVETGGLSLASLSVETGGLSHLPLLG